MQDSRSTYQLLKRVGNNLYRHSKTQTYYGRKVIQGKRKVKSLGTTDRSVANTRLKQWLEELETPTTGGVPTFGNLIKQFLQTRMGKSPSTVTSEGSIAKRLLADFPLGANQLITEAKHSQIEKWLGTLRQENLKANTINRYRLFLWQMFEYARKDGLISSNPVREVPTVPRRRTKPRIPTWTQFENILSDIRSNSTSRMAPMSADFLEFLGKAGLGQAESTSLIWDDVAMKEMESLSWYRHIPGQNAIFITRVKTQRPFYVPIYSHLAPFMGRLFRETLDQRGRIDPSDHLFPIKEAKKSLRAACERLGYPVFTHRNLRQMLIVQLWQQRIDPKLIAKWQGHSDGGKLIIDTYTQVVGDMDDQHESAELKRLRIVST